MSLESQTNTDWENVMEKHAKSFYLASLFFPTKLFPKVKALYALCRGLDDAVDEATSTDEAHQNLALMSADLNKDTPTIPVNSLYKHQGLDTGYMFDLMDGARDDLTLVRIPTRIALIQYCYKVAGTVGLAMFDLMKVKDPKARANAVDLGIAMQITNICRDVKEDQERDRVYIPLDLLAKYGISEEQFMTNRFDRTNLTLAVKDLLLLADEYYASAATAFNTIPWRTRGAIIIASRLYRGIGLKLMEKGADPMVGRTYLNKWEKTKVVTCALLQWITSPLVAKSPTGNPKLQQGLEAYQKLREFGV